MNLKDYSFRSAGHWIQCKGPSGKDSFSLELGQMFNEYGNEEHYQWCEALAQQLCDALNGEAA